MSRLFHCWNEHLSLFSPSHSFLGEIRIMFSLLRFNVLLEGVNGSKEEIELDY